MVQWSSPVVKTNAGELLVSKRPFAATKCCPWLVSKQSPHLPIPRLLGSKLSYTESRYNILPHLLPSSPYRQHTETLQLKKPSVPNITGRLNKRAGMCGYGHFSGKCNGWPVSRIRPLDTTWAGKSLLNLFL
jgi:hypothetical protein